MAQIDRFWSALRIVGRGTKRSLQGGVDPDRASDCSGTGLHCRVQTEFGSIGWQAQFYAVSRLAA